jgi:hypothetical protein
LVDGWGVDRLERAAMEYLRTWPGARLGNPKALQAWLRGQDFRATLPREHAGAAPATTQQPAPFADADVRAIAVERWGEPFARCWLDGGTWDPATRTVTCRTRLAFDRLRRDLFKEFRSADVTLDPPAGTSAGAP